MRIGHHGNVCASRQTSTDLSAKGNEVDPPAPGRAFLAQKHSLDRNRARFAIDFCA